MSIDFSTLQGLTIPEGVVTQITDASGRVIWAVQSGDKVILEVEKITSNTYAGETTYENEQFILLDIYPKTNGTVSVTYGGLTKTITDTSGAEEPNAQQVYFGTFNGVSDSVETPTSGRLTIEGDYYAFGSHRFMRAAKTPHMGNSMGLKSIIDFGNISKIPINAFEFCDSITGSISIPDSVSIIGDFAFSSCHNIKSIIIPASVLSIGCNAFMNLNAAENVTILATTPPTLVITSGNSTYEEHFGSSDSKITLTYPIIVPKGCGVIYKAAENWSKYASRIVEAS